MARQLLETKKFTETENKEILKVIGILMKKYGYSFNDLSKKSGVSMGGMIGLRKNSYITPSMANKLASAFNYEGWHQMLSDFKKNTKKTADAKDSKGWMKKMEEKISAMEQEILDLRDQVMVLTSPTHKNV